eukprot:m.160283 g.160283  ORF g.160283 m.160283 type:complete len:532 (-) comp9848_c3_seq10:869-2464(-)
MWTTAPTRSRARSITWRPSSSPTRATPLPPTGGAWACCSGSLSTVLVARACTADMVISGLTAGTAPFTDPDRDTHEMMKKIIQGPVTFPQHFSPVLIDLLKNLLQFSPSERYDAPAIKAHPFFADVDWARVAARQVTPPFVPEVSDASDVSYFDSEFTSQMPQLSPPVEPLSPSRAMLFRGFSYVAPDILHSPTAFDFNPEPPVSFTSQFQLTPFVLGSGTFSVCRKCIEKCTEREFAVKIIFGERGAPRREAEILRRCFGHPNIIQLHSEHVSPTHTYLVTELMRGGELFDRIRESENFEEHEARDIFSQVLAGVAHLHTLGFVHRDLKPENLLFAAPDSNRLVIADFGFARESTLPLKTPCYTLPYGAPEVLHVEFELGYGPSADMWSLGVILYTMLCGFTPFNLDKSQCFHNELVRRVCETEITFPAPHWDGVSGAARALVAALLEKNPDARITAAEAQRHEWMGDGPVPLSACLSTPSLLKHDGLETSLSASAALNVFLHGRKPFAFDIGQSALAKRRRILRESEME